MSIKISKNNLFCRYSSKCLDKNYLRGSLVVIQTKNDSYGVFMKEMFYGISPLEFQGYKEYFEKLKKGEENIRAIAAFALGQIGDKKTTEDLIKVLESEKSSLVKLECIKALIKIRDEKSIEVLLKTLKDDNASVRSASAIGLGMLKSKEAISNLMQALHDMDSEVRMNAIDSLAEIGATEAIPAIVKKLKDPEATVKRHAVGALGVISSPEAVDELISMLNDGDAITRMMAAWSLAEIGEASIEKIISLLQNSKTDSRYFALEALGLIKSPKSVPVLESLASDPSSEEWVKNIAKDALSKIKKK
jgi:HEAT repeat protein